MAPWEVSLSLPAAGSQRRSASVGRAPLAGHARAQMPTHRGCYPLRIDKTTILVASLSHAKTANMHHGDPSELLEESESVLPGMW